MLKLNNKEVVIIEARSELGAGTFGASLGPAAIRLGDMSAARMLAGCRYIQLSSYDVELDDKKLELPFAINAGYIYDFNRTLKEAVSRELQKGNFVLLLTGDHSNAIGGVSGFRDAFKEDVRVIWIDAHGDLHSPYTTPSGNMHGMPLAALMGFDNKEDQINKVDEQSLWHWEELKKLAQNENGSLKPNQVVFAGIRDLEDQEWDMVEKMGIRHIENSEFRADKISNICNSIANSVMGLPAYISFDVDVLDPEISDGTGTPVPEGLTLEQAVRLLQCLLSQPTTCVLEITEVNPLLDTKSRTVKAVLAILEKIFRR